MKKYIISFMFFIVSSLTMATPLTTQLENKIKKITITTQVKKKAEQAISKASTVEISSQFHLVNPLFVIGGSPENIQQSCLGVLIENYQLAAPISCFKKFGYQLDSFQYTLNGGQQIHADPSILIIKNDIAYISLDKTNETIKGLPYLQVKYAINKKKIHEVFQNFLNEHQVRRVPRIHNRRRGRPWRRMTGPNSALQVGDVLVYKGKVVALVNRKINCYEEEDFPLDILAFFTK